MLARCTRRSLAFPFLLLARLVRLLTGCVQSLTRVAVTGVRRPTFPSANSHFYAVIDVVRDIEACFLTVSRRPALIY